MNKLATELTTESNTPKLNYLCKATQTAIEGLGYGILSLALYAAPMAIIYLIFTNFFNT